MSVTIPPAIARHSFIRRYPNLNEIRHIIDSTGQHEGQSKADKIKKLKTYINTDTSRLLPKFRGPAEYKKEIARNALGKILATNPPVQVEQSMPVAAGGRGKRRRKTKRKKRKTKRRRKKRQKKTRKRNIKANASGVAMYDSKKASGNSNIKKGLEYAEKLVGIKWQYKAPSEDSCPFWNRDGPPPSMQDIKKGGLSCVGVTNLIRRHLGLKIPTESGKWKDLFPGGTGAWFNYLKEKKRLQKINYSKTYPKGTLLLEDWNPKNDGHVAIVWTENKKGLSHSKILHGRHDGPKSVVIEPLDNYTMKKRFTHVCLPENWLAKN